MRDFGKSPHVLIDFAKYFRILPPPAHAKSCTCRASRSIFAVTSKLAAASTRVQLAAHESLDLRVWTCSCLESKRPLLAQRR